MKKESTVGYILRLTLTLLAITALVGAALAGVNALTREKIAAAQRQKTLEAIALVLDKTPENMIETAVGEGLVKTFYNCDGDYAVEVTPAGFDGEITMMVGIREGKVCGISVISHTETPGLGAVAAAGNAVGALFRDQFVGAEGDLAVTKDGGTVDAITGATITSRAVTEGVNAALEFVKNLPKED